MSEGIDPIQQSKESNSTTTLQELVTHKQEDLVEDLTLSHNPIESMTFTDVNYDAVINHPSGDGQLMQETMEKIIEPNNVRILSKQEFLELVKAGQIDYSCIDGRSVANPDKVTVHVAGDAFGLYVLSTMQMLQDLGISADLDDTIVRKFIEDNAIKPTSHTDDHCDINADMAACGCGHCKHNTMTLDKDLLELVAQYYEQSDKTILHGEHLEQAIVVSTGTNNIVLVNTTNDLIPGDKTHNAERQIFWNDAGAIQVLMEHYAPLLAQSILSISGQTVDPTVVAQAWYAAYNKQLNHTV